ncbi:CRISPR-associated endonuclease Cas2 [Rhodoferax sp.]|uniref:CRISPR-associated endonuclease Cas2 n=1 Tax=Rhodoferax sp. TaxID=50421 RepID=UPI00275F6151|nr:CRISPR-associated endonuclease Cas2 [Rhodoferax sp.]
MSLHANARWLVTYDIADPRRLARVFKFLKKQGVPVQYSVFQVDASAAKTGNLMVQMAKLIDADADDVRAYRLPENTWKTTLGAGILPEGVLVTAKDLL